MKVLYRENCSHSSVSTLYVDSDLGPESNLVKIEENCAHHKGLEKCKVWLRTVFLPEGFPNSVSSDYVSYQVWDTVQAFASSISGSLATTAVLKGVGVGDSTATPLAATLTWLLRDGFAMVGRIVFAAYSGTGLDHDCKKWRMFADVLNDLAMCVELVAGSLPKAFFLPLVCVAGVGRSLVGVAGGATKAAVAQHQAKENNMADLAAKDGSQETLVNLVALIVNICLLPYVTEDAWITATLFVLLTFLHVYANYRAVTSLLLETLNVGRLSLILTSYLETSNILSIKEANQKESILLWTEQPNITVGASLSSAKISKRVLEEKVEEMKASEKAYFLFAKNAHVTIFVKTGAGPSDILEAYVEAFFMLDQSKQVTVSPKELTAKLESEGWRTDILSIPTKGFTFSPVDQE